MKGASASPHAVHTHGHRARRWLGLPPLRAGGEQGRQPPGTCSVHVMLTWRIVGWGPAASASAARRRVMGGAPPSPSPSSSSLVVPSSPLEVSSSSSLAPESEPPLMERSSSSSLPRRRRRPRLSSATMKSRMLQRPGGRGRERRKVWRRAARGERACAGSCTGSGSFAAKAQPVESGTRHCQPPNLRASQLRTRPDRGTQRRQAPATPHPPPPVPNRRASCSGRSGSAMPSPSTGSGWRTRLRPCREGPLFWAYSQASFMGHAELRGGGQGGQRQE